MKNQVRDRAAIYVVFIYTECLQGVERRIESLPLTVVQTVQIFKGQLPFRQEEEEEEEDEEILSMGVKRDVICIRFIKFCSAFSTYAYSGFYLFSPVKTGQRIMNLQETYSVRRYFTLYFIFLILRVLYLHPSTVELHLSGL